VQDEESEYESDDDIYWYDCPWCQDIWETSRERDAHIVICQSRI
jgi:hypothetical protein